MKKFGRKHAEEMSMQAPNCAAILAILAEMARRVNENISKVDLKPIQVLVVPSAADSTASAAEVSKG
jgi:hypothetical protein